MTTIEEDLETMDEFFNFEDAAHSSPYNPAPYDIDLAFAEPENDLNTFQCLQHFGDTSPEQQLSFDLHNAMQDTTSMGAEDFTDFPRWIEGMDVPTRPCEYCAVMHIHCKVIKEGLRKGSCTSCVALARGCSLVSPPGKKTENEYQRYHGVVIPNSDAMVNAGEEGVWTGGEIWEQNKSTEDFGNFSQSNSATDLKGLNSSTKHLEAEVESAPKVGARFSRESVRILRGWLSTHHRHPYPSDDEKESLQRQTGLNKTQITNWLANARRRGKVRAPRSVSPSPQQFANGMDIPRRATPSLQQMNPMERWKHSPPEHEPASVTAIANAVSSSTYSSGLDSPYTRYGLSDDGSSRSLCNVSSTSSLGTSHSSGGSFASAFSHKSRGSFGSFSSLGNRGRRRRRRQAPKPVKVSNLAVAPRTFQCTFCTETFKTKHDWQRHEKSLHLSLERWVCSPNGPYQINPETNTLSCVFCGMANPPDGHAEQHNHSSCVERSLEERTFYRKDHLRQHLNLVHDAKFSAWSMDSWKIATPEIRSRCGFCGIVMDSWTIRVDHLAEHFKGGKSMADWKGDWGFEPQVLDIVENGMPPYLIHDERKTMRPFEASKTSATLRMTLEDQVKLGLVDYINDRVVKGNVPTDEDLLLEACTIIRKSEAVLDSPQDIEESWFRDLIRLSHKMPQDESSNSQLQSLPQATLSNMTWAEKLNMINLQAGNTGMHDLSSIRCPKERLLKEYVKSRTALGLTPTDGELQIQACKILDEIEMTSNFKCKGAVQWFKYLILDSSDWLSEFRRRAVLPRSSEMASENIRPSDATTIDHSIHNYHRLERELIAFISQEQAMGRSPTDVDLQRQARLIIFESDDEWNQTAADDPKYLHAFKRGAGLVPIDEEGPADFTLPMVGELAYNLLSSPGSSPPAPSIQTLHWDLENTSMGQLSPVSGSDLMRTPAKATTKPSTDQPLHTLVQNQPSTNTNPTQPLRYFLNDANCYGRLVRELNRFVTSCMSPNNPAQHIPTDAEIQNQARWVIYDDDDPWNQTAADNAEWLIRFKRQVGLLPSDEGPGLPLDLTSWQVSNGGTGFSPPYLLPSDSGKNLPKYSDDVNVSMSHQSFKVNPKTAEQFISGLGTRLAPPASVFCSRDLENGLGAFVKMYLANGTIPTDAELQTKAREILGIDRTAADEPDLLEKFKALHGISSNIMGNGPIQNYSLPNFTDDVNMLAGFDMELGPTDFTTDFSTGGLNPITNTTVSQFMNPTGNLGFDINSGQDQLSTLGNGMTINESEDINVDTLGDLQDYADAYRVSAATASPLRRRASERLATSSGLQKPIPTRPANISLLSSSFASGDGGGGRS